MSAGDWMRRATTRQRAITAELFQMAGLQERVVERERALRQRMSRLVSSNLPIVVGPWTVLAGTVDVPEMDVVLPANAVVAPVGNRLVYLTWFRGKRWK